MAGDTDVDLAFAEGLVLSEGAAAALEDYARVLTRAGGAFVLREDGNASELVRGLRLRAAAERPVPDAVAADVFAFARGLAEGRGGGLGWS